MIPALPETPALTIRPAEHGDVATVAALHAASWRIHYRGSLSDTYLDGSVEAERLAVWTRRLREPAPNQRVLLAIADEMLLGFVCLFLDHDPSCGTLIDNLHVTIGSKRHGIGRRLMHAAGLTIAAALPERPATLYVLEANTAARAFYDRIGGTVVERTHHTEPDGSFNPVLRYQWASPVALVDATAV